MSTMAFQITGVSRVCSTVCSGADQRKHQSSTSLTFVRGIHRRPVDSPHKGPVTRKMFLFDDVIVYLGQSLYSLGDNASYHQISLKPQTLYSNARIARGINRISAAVCQPVALGQNWPNFADAIFKKSFLIRVYHIYIYPCTFQGFSGCACIIIETQKVKWLERAGWKSTTINRQHVTWSHDITMEQSQQPRHNNWAPQWLFDSPISARLQDKNRGNNHAM